MSRETELALLLAMYQQKFGTLAEKAVEAIKGYLASGYSAEKAVQMGLNEAGYISDITGTNGLILDAAVAAAALELGKQGTNYPKARKILLSDVWASDKMKLSDRLHGAKREMRQRIVDSVSTSMRQGKTWTEASRRLYDGYSAGKITNQAELPNYLKELTAYARKVLAGDKAAFKKYQAAVNSAQAQVNKLAQNGAPTKVMKQTFQNLVDAAKDLNEEAINKSVKVAVEEKSRYIADRILRTEMSEAWGDVFFAKTLNDPDVIAYKWQLSSRHPQFDICDLHANIDAYGLGPGVYPKDKFPVRPAHPHCFCLVKALYVGNIDMNSARENNRLKEAKFNPSAVDGYLSSLSKEEQQALLGVDGLKVWNSRKRWQPYLKLWQGFGTPQSRLSVGDFTSSGEKPSKLELIDRIDVTDADLISRKLAEYEESIANETVEYAFVITEQGEVYKVSGDALSVNPSELESKLYQSIVTHNHPVESGGGSFSYEDIEFFFRHRLKKLRAVSDKKVYTLTYSGEYPSVSDILKAYSKAVDRHREKLTIEDVMNMDYDEKDGNLQELVKDIEGLTYSNDVQ